MRAVSATAPTGDGTESGEERAYIIRGSGGKTLTGGSKWCDGVNGEDSEVRRPVRCDDRLAWRRLVLLAPVWLL